MKPGDKIKTKYQGEEDAYGTIVYKSNSTWTAGQWAIDFIIPFQARATREPNYIFKVDRIEELLYF